MAKLSLKGITFPSIHPGFRPAPGEFNFAVQEKEFLVLAGPSGGGKTALLRMISGLDHLSSGSILVEDKQMAGRMGEIAMVFAGGALYPQMSVRENLAFGLKVAKVPQAEADRRIKEAASILGIDSLLESKAGNLSGTEEEVELHRVRIALGRAMVRQPKVYLLDAPLKGLGKSAQRGLQAEIAMLHERLQATFIYATSDPSEALTLATRIVVVSGGVIQQEGTPVEIYLNPANLFVASFFGAPPMNLIHGKLKEVAEGLQFREAGEGSILCVLPESAGARDYIGKEVVLGLRPEHIKPKLEEAHSGTSRRQAGALMKGLVDLVEPTGAETLIHLQTGAHSLSSRHAGFLDRSHAGRRLQFELELTKATLFDPASTLRVNTRLQTEEVPE